MKFDDANKFLRKLPIEKYSLAKFVLDTGKKHQIRKQSYIALKSPIFCDSKYGFDEEMNY